MKICSLLVFFHIFVLLDLFIFTIKTSSHEKSNNISGYIRFFNVFL